MKPQTSMSITAHGYTLVAKGVEKCSSHHLYHENRMYQHVSSAQGVIVPVCLGLTDLDNPYFYDGRVYTLMLFLSWAGRPLFTFANQGNKAALLNEAKLMLGELHRLGLLHKDSALRNMLWDDRTDHPMWTDLERAEICDRRPLRALYSSQKRKKTTRKTSCAEDPFSNEIRQLSAHVARLVS
ncbi:hypothetical protein DM02DRAFT_664118 [Periconia macrospinosa]|uniref:Protein kinase domain-containing protein n=1 Tax=Periconia macrospinosa TaxID=97972 RepID=A0A2V1CZW3_9PLEO|nr:hypothetical protein DM02DRAFT_664118 [Periconia macrospinosa]